MSRKNANYITNNGIPRIQKMCYARYEKPLKHHPLDVAKKYVETYSSSNTAARNTEERAFLTN